MLMSTANNLIVKVIPESEPKTKSGLLLTVHKPHQLKAEIMAVGEKVDACVKVGMIAIIPDNFGAKFKVDDVEYLSISAVNIYGVLGSA